MLIKVKRVLSLLKSKRSFFKENIWVVFTEYLWLFGVFIISVLFNRFYGTEALGVFSYGTAMSQIAILGLGSAFSNLIMRDVGANSKLYGVYLTKVIQIRGGIIILTLFVVSAIQYAFVSISDPSNFLFIIILIVSKGLDALCDTFYMVFLSLKFYKKYSFIKSLHTIGAICFVALSCIFHYPITVTYLAIFFNALLFFVFNIIYFNSLKTESNRIESPVASSNSATKTPKAITFQYLAKEIWPLLLSGIFFQVGTRLNTLIIFGIMGGVCLGVYSSGLMLITCFTAAAPFMGIVLFPVLNRTFIETPNRLGRVILKIIPVVFLVGLSVMLISYLSIPFALKLMKNMPDYASAIFAIMIWAIPFNYVIGIINSLFIIIKKQKTGMFVTFAIMLMNIALVYIGAFYDQIRGVALAYVAASIFQMALFVIIYFYVNNKSIQKKPVASI